MFLSRNIKCEKYSQKNGMLCSLGYLVKKMKKCLYLIKELIIILEIGNLDTRFVMIYFHVGFCLADHLIR